MCTVAMNNPGFSSDDREANISLTVLWATILLVGIVVLVKECRRKRTARHNSSIGKAFN
jgi:hypothetical protein